MKNQNDNNQAGEHKKQITPEERRRQLEEIEEHLRTDKIVRVIPAEEIIKQNIDATPMKKKRELNGHEET
jgi:hypothetical protein